MIVRLRFIFSFSILLFCLNNSLLEGQILRDTSSVVMVKSCIDNIYNYQFREADEISVRISQQFPGHPVEFLLKGLMTFWENYPLLPNTGASAIFEENMRKCIDISEKKLDSVHDSDYSEYLLTNLCGRGMLLLFYADNDLSMEVFPWTLSTYRYIRRSFSYTSEHCDFYYFTGIYNYYRKVYPEVYPIYKPLAALIPKGDKEKGIKDLLNAAGNSVVLRAESFSFLSEVYLRFEGDYQMATYFNKTLYELYRANPEYEEDYIKNLLLIKQYDEAERLIDLMWTTKDNQFFRAQLSILKGILKEKKYHDYKQARELYNKGIDDIYSFGKYGNEFTAYAYFGLSRITENKTDKYDKKMYRKMANELAALKKINFD
jgi:hypothetical protein